MDNATSVYLLTWLSWILPISLIRDILIIIMILRKMFLDGLKLLNEPVDKEENKTE